MKTILTRLRRLEKVTAPLERGREIVEAIRASRRRRMEADGERYEEPIQVDLKGCYSIGERITRARRAKMELQAQRDELAKQNSVR